MMFCLKSVPPLFFAYGALIVAAETAQEPLTMVMALTGGFTLLLGTLVWVVKKQMETFPQALKEQQLTFTDAMAKQQMIFCTMLDKIREDNAKNLAIVANNHKEAKTHP